MDMTAKDFLMQYQAAKRKARFTQERLDGLRAELLPRGISYSGMPGGSPKTSADILAQIDELERRLGSQLKQALEIMAEVTDVIEQVSDERCKNVLLARYICGKSWERIADEENYSWRHVLRLHGEGLKEISMILIKI